MVFVPDLRTFSSINCKNSNSFVVTADGSGAYFFVDDKNSFNFVNFETGEETELAIGKFTTIDCTNFLVYSTDLFPTFGSDSADPTLFIGIIHDRKLWKYFCVLFSANRTEKFVSILDEVDTYWNNVNTPYICATSCSKYYCFDYLPFDKTLTIGQIALAETGKIDFEIIARCDQLENPSKNIHPFTDGEAVYYFSGDHWDRLIKIPLNETTNVSHISLSHSKIEKLQPLQRTLPQFFNTNIFYCISVSENETVICSLNMKLFSWSHQVAVNHHRRNYSLFYDTDILKILPDGSACLQINFCTECPATSHIFQFDLSIGSKYFVSQNELGRGGFGIVFEGKIGDEKIAVKVMQDFSNLSIGRQRQILLSAISEARKLKMLKHTNLIKGFGFKIEEKRFLLFMELMKESVRQKILRKPEKRINEKEMFCILQQALEGLVYLHRIKPKPIIHRDIKCANLLLDENEIVKLGDFGLFEAVSLNTAGTTDYDHAPSKIVGTAYWQAPEVLAANAVYGRKADIWSIGCSLVEMLTGYPPYYTLQQTQWAIGLHDGSLTYDPRQLVPNVSKDVANILEKCFTRQTTKNIQTHLSQPIRPHSWELLAEVIAINELKPLEEKVEGVRQKIANLFRFRQTEDD